MARLPKGQGVIPLPPFSAFLASNIPAVYDNTMSYYEELCALLKYLQDQVTPALNSNAEAITILSNYVEHYFDNLDVQEEINNKLDEMVESGELQRILNSPATTDNIGGVIIGNGINVDASGKIDVKAGDGITVDEDGVSVTPFTNYLNIACNKVTYVNGTTSTTVNYSIIPAEYSPKIVMSDPLDADTQRRASDIDYLYKPTLMTNLSPWNTDSNVTYGPLIVDNVVKVENNLADGTGWNRPIIGIDDDGMLHNISGDTAASAVNMKYACRAWQCLYNDGETNPNLGATIEPRTFLAQDYDGNYLVGVCGGRTATDTGMTLQNIISFVRTELNFSARLIYNLDGGGSSNILYHGIRQNSTIAGEDRACPTWLVWTSQTAKDNGEFRSQSINNIALLGEEIGEYGVVFTGSDVVKPSANVSFGPQSVGMITAHRQCTINFAFTASANLSSYTEIIDKLPQPATGGNVYIMIENTGTHTFYSTYLSNSSNYSGYSRLRNIQTLPAGDYQVNITYVATLQY